MSKTNETTTSPQWRFDRSGIEAPAERYFIATNRLADTREVAGGRVFDLPLHLAEKGWVSMAEFWPVFRSALVAKGERIDPDMWARTCAAAEHIAEQERAHLAERERQIFALEKQAPNSSAPGLHPRYRPVSLRGVRAEMRRRP